VSGARADAAVAALLAKYDDDIRALAEASRRLLREILPGIEETVDAKANLLGYGYGPGYKGLVATLILSKKGVKIGVVRGSELADPRGLMTGAGKVHRHVPIAKLADLKRPGLETLLKSALAAWKARSGAAS
jgi:hypothetical protein